MIFQNLINPGCCRVPLLGSALAAKKAGLCCKMSGWTKAAELRGVWESGKTIIAEMVGTDWCVG